MLISSFIRESEKPSTLIEWKWTQVLEKKHPSSEETFQIHLISVLSCTSSAYCFIRTKAGSFEILQ